MLLIWRHIFDYVRMRMRRNEKGASRLEYIVLAGLIVVVLIAAVVVLGKPPTVESTTGQ